MSERRWVNQYQPQTLVMGTMLCYLQAVFGFLFGVVATSVFFALLTIIGLAAGGYGIANEKKWGYSLAVGSAVLQVAMLVIVGGTEVLGFPLIVSLLFDCALVALLLHRQSREYQRIWFS